jgi:hypothetical protein
MVLSYIFQSAIALAGFLLLTILTFAIHTKRSSMRNPTSNRTGADPRNLRSRWRDLEEHCTILISTIADFQKAQCYFCIAMQIGALATIFTDLDATSWINQNFLLLVSVDGLVPIVLTLYTLMTYGQKSWYIIILSVTTVVLSAISGGLLASKMLPIETERRQTLDVVVRSGDQAACGGVGPFQICQNLGPNVTANPNLAKRYLIAMCILVVVTALLVLWKIVTETTTIGTTMSAWLARMLTPGGNYDAVNEDQRRIYERSLRRVLSMSRRLFHGVVTLCILGVLVAELYEVNFGLSRVVPEWSFGQIVGLVTWASIFIDLAYVEYSKYCSVITPRAANGANILILDGMSDGMAWRFPSWLTVTEDGYGDGAQGGAPTHPNTELYPQYEADLPGTDSKMQPMGYSADYSTAYPATQPGTYHVNEHEHEPYPYPNEHTHHNLNLGVHPTADQHNLHYPFDEIRHAE